ncbi:hypothetical protein KO489_08170 [Reinekea forsetii]|nr:hypothetical protein [Reinekea forsetii]
MLQIVHSNTDHTEPLTKVEDFYRSLAKTNQFVTFDIFKGDHFSIREIALTGIVNEAVNSHRQWKREYRSKDILSNHSLELGNFDILDPMKQE